MLSKVWHEEAPINPGGPHGSSHSRNGGQSHGTKVGHTQALPAETLVVWGRQGTTAKHPEQPDHGIEARQVADEGGPPRGGGFEVH